MSDQEHNADERIMKAIGIDDVSVSFMHGQWRAQVFDGRGTGLSAIAYGDTLHDAVATALSLRGDWSGEAREERP